MWKSSRRTGEFGGALGRQNRVIMVASKIDAVNKDKFGKTQALLQKA